MRVQALVLAAGASTRFGADKRLATLPDTSTVIETTLGAYVQAFARVSVVFRPGEAEHAELARGLGCEVVYAADAGLGMGHSLAAGIRAIAATECDWVFVGLSDMPFVRVRTLRTLLASVGDDGGIVRPIVQVNDRERVGHPIGWSRWFFKELGEASGDQGARGLLRKYSDRVRTVEVDDPGVCLDIDTPNDLGAGQAYEN